MLRLVQPLHCVAAINSFDPKTLFAHLLAMSDATARAFATFALPPMSHPLRSESEPRCRRDLHYPHPVFSGFKKRDIRPKRPVAGGSRGA